MKRLLVVVFCMLAPQAVWGAAEWNDVRENYAGQPYVFQRGITSSKPFLPPELSVNEKLMGQDVQKSIDQSLKETYEKFRRESEEKALDKIAKEYLEGIERMERWKAEQENATPTIEIISACPKVQPDGSVACYDEKNKLVTTIPPADPDARALRTIISKYGEVEVMLNRYTKPDGTQRIKRLNLNRGRKLPNGQTSLEGKVFKKPRPLPIPIKTGDDPLPNSIFHPFYNPFRR